MLQSEFWKWFSEYMKWRRESLFLEKVKTNEEIWLNRGAIAEVSRMIHAPRLIVAQYLSTKRQSEAGTSDESAWKGPFSLPKEFADVD